MENKNYKALVVREENGKFKRSIEQVGFDFLPKNEVLIRVAFAALNYKDALSANGHKGISRNFPHTPGVDAAGIVEKSSHSDFAVGDKVFVTSFDLGMGTKGGFAEYVCVPAAWVIPLPNGISLEESMIMGTGGFTAALALHKMEMSGQNPEMGEILITGASGGVGSMAVAIFAKVGYRVIASSGKSEHYPWLSDIGAKRCVNREEIIDPSEKPLISAKWAGAVDTVGGKTLANILRACGRNGNVAVCGLVGSSDLDTTVYPFILNGVNLLGIESAETPPKLRMEVWNGLAERLKPSKLNEMATIVKLEEIPRYMDDILAGETVGRVVANLAL